MIARLAAVGTFVIVGAFSLPVRAEELAQNLGPVGPRETILATVGSKRVIAFYTPDGGHCDTHVPNGHPFAEAAPRTHRAAAAQTRRRG